MSGTLGREADDGHVTMATVPVQSEILSKQSEFQDKVAGAVVNMFSSPRKAHF
jgi:hypothetical protein